MMQTEEAWGDNTKPLSHMEREMWLAYLLGELLKFDSFFGEDMVLEVKALSPFQQIGLLKQLNASKWKFDVPDYAVLFVGVRDFLREVCGSEDDFRTTDDIIGAAKRYSPCCNGRCSHYGTITRVMPSYFGGNFYCTACSTICI